MSDPAIPRIALAIPTRDLCAAPFTKCVADMVGRFCTLYVGTGQAELTTIIDLGTLLSDMRIQIAKEAMNQGCTHILWLDNDMVFPSDMLERLIQHDKPIVAASYAQRKSPSKPVAARGGVWVYTEDTSTGLEEVDYVGSGCMLVQTDVYKHLPMPWYMLGWNEKKQETVGEDVYFCRKARQIGAACFIDHDLTKEIGHIGTRVFTMEDAVKDRPTLLARQTSQDTIKIAEPA